MNFTFGKWRDWAGFLVVASALGTPALAQEAGGGGVIINITSEDLYNGLQEGVFDVLVDVRPAAFWEQGHIENATSLPDMAFDGSPEALAGCEECRIAVYCGTGYLASLAAVRLVEAGFQTIYNGLGVTQWKEAGYPLVMDQESVVPPCTLEDPGSAYCVQSSELWFPPSPPTGVIMNITSEDLYIGLKEGTFDLLVDVRSVEEFEEGHIEGATLVQDLAMTADVAALAGCEECRIALYCRSGRRASVAAVHLVKAGFQTIYNGLGIRQWQEAGYELVTDTESVVAPCTLEDPGSEYCVSSPGVWLPRKPPLGVIINITSEELYNGLKEGAFDVLVDVRPASFWEEGHIENATSLPDMASDGSPEALAGCEECRIAVYCGTGYLASLAAVRLVEAGFQNIYNGLGVTQWQEAGYPLVTDPESVVPPCTVELGNCVPVVMDFPVVATGSDDVESAAANHLAPGGMWLAPWLFLYVLMVAFGEW